ncbi:MAG TPA: hypothetical protein VF173_03730 [Thermoanaerobaculia bacterium]|nr:hypothetical protein [Thermoanaerobaculia bacterium]
MKARRLLLIVALAMPCSLAAASGPVSPATPPELAEDGISKAASVGSDLRISGVQISVCLTSDVRVNFWDPLKIVAAANDYTGTSEDQFYSTDGGKTWGQSALPLLPGDVYYLNPTVDWTSDGTAWSVVVGVNSSLGQYRLRAYKSIDHGATWVFDGTPSGTHSNVYQGGMLWADHSSSSPFKDTLYTTWQNLGLGYVGRRTPGASGTWQTPVRIGGAETTGTPVGSEIKTNANGEVFGFWNDIGSRRLFVAKSTNGGASFGAAVAIASTWDLYQFSVPAMRNAQISVSGGVRRTATKNLVYATWADLKGTNGCDAPIYEPGSDASSSCKTRVWFARSTDGGATWSTPVRINDQASLNDQLHPKLAVDETDGTLGITYYDTVADPRRRKTDVWFQSSHDDGVTWSAATKLTSAPTDESVETAEPNNQYGLHNGLSGVAGQFFATWTDRRTNGSEEIWGAGIREAVCTNPGAPVAGTAASVGVNQVQVTWGNGSPSASRFNVYRAPGTCAAPGAFTRVGTAVAGSTLVDTDVSGGSTYAYQVRGTDASGVCESAPSGCMQVTATGACRLPPAFAGITSAVGQAALGCGIALSWPAATSACGGSITYNVYQSGNPVFTPDNLHRLASHVTGTSYLDPLPEGSPNFPIYYIVRAVDSANGLEEGNLVTRGATPTGPATYLLNETFEGPGGFDNPGWTHASYIFDPGSDWTWSTAQSRSSAHSWFSPGWNSEAQKALISPSFVPQAGTLLSFWHTYSFDDSAGCYDAGILQVSTNGGGTWSTMPDAAFRWGSFNGTVYFGSNGYAGSRAWCHGTIGPMTLVQVDLSAYAGTPIQLRWIESDDNLIGFTGWYMDDVTVANAAACRNNPIFSDSFENGNLAAWTDTTP